MLNDLLLVRPSYWKYFTSIIRNKSVGLLRPMFLIGLTLILLLFPVPSLTQSPDIALDSTPPPLREFHNEILPATILSRITTSSIPSVSIIAVGDVMPGRQIYARSIEYDNYLWPYAATSHILNNADLTLGNLESPLVSGCPPGGSTMRLCSSPEAQLGLSEAGFDGLSLANNHSFDYGATGFQNTIVTLQNSGISPLLNGGMMIYQLHDMRIGVIALEDTYANPLQIENVVPTIQQAKYTTDVLISLIHWGIEYTDQPTPQQQMIGHTLIDAGVNVVIGSHPHWTQPIEQYQSGLIFYSLGNFVFDQDWSEKTRQGLIVRLQISKQTDSLEITYQTERIRIDDTGQPRPITAPPIFALSMSPE